MAEWFDDAIAKDPFDPAALAARNRALPETDEDPIIPTLEEAEKSKGTWYNRLPRNIGVGLYKAAINTIKTGADLSDVLAVGAQHGERVEEGSRTGVDTPPVPIASAYSHAPEFFDAADQFGDELTENNTLSDDIIQGVAQFAIPFAAYMRAFGGYQAGATLVNVAKTAAAETAVSATAFDPHDGRMADLLEMGRQSEGKFGDLLRQVSPDGSLANAYINWMTSRGVPDATPVEATTLDDQQEAAYRQWMQQIGHTKEAGYFVDENFTGTDYDYRGHFAKYGPIDVQKGQHFTDEFKLPNHETFSNESRYAVGPNAARAGRWDANGTFIPPRGEGEWEGRFKNSVDNLVTSGVLGTVLKTAATGFKGVRRIAAEPMKVGADAQRGAVGDLTDIERARALKNTEVVEGGEHIVLEGDTLNQTGNVVPLKPTAVAEPVIPNTRDRLNELLDKTGRRLAMEEQGQGILDDMAERAIKPRDSAAEFWKRTYPLLNAETQGRFTRYLKSLGFEPGYVGSVDAQGNKTVLKDWMQVADFVNEDLPSNPEHLEGIERGYVALMEWANRQRHSAQESHFSALENK